MKQVKILSGISGSGKSRYCGLLLETYVDSIGLTAEQMMRLPEGDMRASSAICSADLFFSKGGSYKFDPTKLGDAHGECFREYITALQRGCEFVVVDNTNTTVEEISPYILGAQAYGYDAEVITLLPPEGMTSEDYLHLCHERNKHGVSFGGVMSQLGRLNDRKLPPWWKVSRARSSF